jgi:hypothetical protein
MALYFSLSLFTRAGKYAENVFNYSRIKNKHTTVPPNVSNYVWLQKGVSSKH